MFCHRPDPRAGPPGGSLLHPGLAPRVGGPCDASGVKADGTSRLLISCPDRAGIVAAVSGFLFRHGANIISSDQYSTDPSGGRFFMRMEFTAGGLDLGREQLATAFGLDVAEGFDMSWRIAHSDQRKRVAILVSRPEHCLLDLLWRWRRRELDADMVLVASNHRDREQDVLFFGVPFHDVPMPGEGGNGGEEALLDLLAGQVDLVVLARFMQILSGGFLDRLGVPLINIHHSFLPAFIGAAPYRRAKERGVKLVGATAHYVTEDLDEGPIIEQDVVRVDHRHTVADLARLGADVERMVLSRAVLWHCEDRIIRYGNQTVVF